MYTIYNHLITQKKLMLYGGLALLLLLTLTILQPVKAETVKQEQQVWFITGANRGLGEAIAKAALANGDKVVATARNIETAQKTLGQSANLLIVKLDVTQPEQIKQATQAAINKFGHIDVLVNNAGYGQLGYFEEITDAAIKRQFEVNVFGAMNVTRAILPQMRQQKSGYILTMSSIGGVVGSAGCSVYCASKFALEGWMESLSYEVNPLGIHTTLIEPGGFRTDFLDHSSVKYGEVAITDYQERSKNYKANYDAANHKQIGDPIKLANTVVSLVKSSNPPMRFLAGTDAVERTERQLKIRQEELRKWRNLSISLGFTAK